MRRRDAWCSQASVAIRRTSHISGSKTALPVGKNRLTTSANQGTYLPPCLRVVAVARHAVVAACAARKRPACKALGRARVTGRALALGRPSRLGDNQQQGPVGHMWFLLNDERRHPIRVTPCDGYRSCPSSVTYAESCYKVGFTAPESAPESAPRRPGTNYLTNHQAAAMRRQRTCADGPASSCLVE